MKRREFILDGQRIRSMSGFHDEVERVFTRDLDWDVGRNLDAFNDLLWGGFGQHEYEEKIAVVWTHSAEAKRRLGRHFDEIISVITDHENDVELRMT